MSSPADAILISRNIATADHPVVREIVRRGRAKIIGNSTSVLGERIKLGLVVEGGAMRGIYSGALLVAMEQLGLSHVFDKIYGESAGAINACYFLSRQGSSGIQIYVDDLTSLKFANPFRIGTILDVDYAIETVVKRLKPLDIESVLNAPSDLYIAVTSVLTGESRVIDAKRDGVPILTLLKATGAIVPLYNHSVEIQGEAYVDGGIANPIPVQSAIEGGCNHILVLLTRAPAFAARPYSTFNRFWLSSFLRGWPRPFVDAFYRRQSSVYNNTRDLAFGKHPCKDGVKIAVLGPGNDSPLIGRATVSRKRLLAAKDDAIKRALEVFGSGGK